MIDGILIIDKETDMTSHDAVRIVKRTLGAKKVGHLGTLDPSATGVLALVINKATKYADKFGGGEKIYSATVKLGEVTDTYDQEGKITEIKSVEGVTAGDVEKALKSFVGKISQLPPMFSAVKKNGTPLYKLARKGIEVEREAKEVEIFKIDSIEVDMPNVSFKVSCSRGTYIRTLAFDLGEKLGVGGHLTALRRTGSGMFHIEDSVSPRLNKEELEERIIPLGKLLMEFEEKMEEKTGVSAATTGGISSDNSINKTANL